MGENKKIYIVGYHCALKHLGSQCILTKDFEFNPMGLFAIAYPCTTTPSFTIFWNKSDCLLVVLNWKWNIYYEKWLIFNKFSNGK